MKLYTIKKNIDIFSLFFLISISKSSYFCLCFYLWEILILDSLCFIKVKSFFNYLVQFQIIYVKLQFYRRNINFYVILILPRFTFNLFLLENSCDFKSEDLVSEFFLFVIKRSLFFSQFEIVLLLTENNCGKIYWIFFR